MFGRSWWAARSASSASCLLIIPGLSLIHISICLLGEALRQLFLLWYDKTMAGTLTSIALIFLSALATLPGWYQKLAAKAGAGTLVPITGFANSVVSPAIAFKAEGWVTGVGANIFTIAGPVIAFGTLASFVWGVVYWLVGKVG